MVNTPRRSAFGGFTLVELLVVLAIILMLAAVVAGVTNGVLTSTRLTQSSEAAVGILAQARRTALARSHIVEVCFFQCANLEDASSTVQWRAMQAVELLENGQRQPLGRAMILPNRFILSGTKTISTLLGDGTKYDGPPSLTPEYLTKVPVADGCHRFRFMPDGSTDLSLLDPGVDPSGKAKQWFMTIYREEDRPKGDPPPNYVTIQIEPATGAISVYRP